MAEVDYREIIALSEDPDVSFDGNAGRPFTDQEDAWLAELADSIFLRRPVEKQVADIRDMPIEVSVRRLSQVSVPQQNEILSRIPDDLADKLRSQLPVWVG
ncbi:MAG: hypothetical protein OXD34_07485 [bacterium]|nr:hypothetical protein [bacterium]